MTKVSSLLCVLILFISLLACKGENDTSNSSTKRNLKLNENDLPGILKRGKIIVLAENSATSYFIYKGKKLGFEYEILKEFAEDLGVAIEVKLVNDLTEMNEKLNAGEGDFIACNYTVTMDRKEDIEFEINTITKSGKLTLDGKPKGDDRFSSTQKYFQNIGRSILEKQQQQENNTQTSFG